MTEHDFVWHYCKCRPLHRPDTNFISLSVFLLQLAGISLMLDIVMFLMAKQFCSHLSFLQSCLVIFAIVAIVSYRKLAIILIELYQHYAPESLRRKCICMPTCSEYAIACIRKYNAFKAFYRIYRRLTKECVGQVYHIDNP